MEQDKPKNLLILGYTAAIVIMLIGMVIFVDQYLRADVRKEYQKKVLQSENVQLRGLRAEEDGKLGKLVWVDQTKGVVRLPAARARELVLKEWAARPDGVVQPAVVPGAAPAPAPADGAAAPAGAPAAAPAPAAPAAPAPAPGGANP